MLWFRTVCTVCVSPHRGNERPRTDMRRADVTTSIWYASVGIGGKGGGVVCHRLIDFKSNVFHHTTVVRNTQHTSPGPTARSVAGAGLVYVEIEGNNENNYDTPSTDLDRK